MTGVTIRLINLLSKVEVGRVFLLWYIFGLIIFHAVAQWSSAWFWNYLYYWWDSVNAVFAIAVVFKYVPALIRRFLPIFIYAIIRSCLYILVGFFHKDMNAPIIVATLFWLALAACIYLTLNRDE